MNLYPFVFHRLPSRTIFGAAALMAAAFLALSARAAEATDPSDSSGGDQVVKLPEFSVSDSQDSGYRASNSVSGTRIAMPIKDLPFSVSAFTQQFKTDIGARDLGEIVQYAPGVTAGAKQIVNGDASYMIRGFQQAPQVNGFTTPNSSAVAGGFVDTSAIERVEVVKGPASLLYGQVAPGGTVNYITKQGEDKRFATLTETAGSYDFWRLTADINQPLIDKKLLFRFNTAYEHGYRYFKPSGSRTRVYVPSLTWRPVERVKLKIDYQDFKRVESPPVQFKLPIEIVAAAPTSGILGTAGVLQNPLDLSDPGFLGFYPLPRTFNVLSNHDSRTSHFQTLATELELTLGDHWRARGNVSSNWGYNGFKQTGLLTVNVDVPASYTSKYPTYGAAAAAYAAAILQDPNVALTAPHAQLPRRQLLRENFGHTTALQAEIAGSYILAGAQIRPLFGAYYDTGMAFDRRRQTGTNGTYTLFTTPSAANKLNQLGPWDFANPSLFPIDPTTDFDPSTVPLTTYTGTHFHTKAVYGLLNASLFKQKLVIVSGARLNQSDTVVTNFLTNPAVFNPVSPTYTPAYKAHKVTPQVAMGYKIEESVSVYASYSESYQANTFLKAGDQPGLTAKPTTSKGYETGVKTDLLQGRVSSTVAVYQIEQRDRIISLNVASPTGAIGSYDFQGTVDRSKGVETEVTLSPTDNWQVYASVAENDVRTIGVRPGLEVYLGSHPQSSAKTLANLWTRYSFTSDPIKGLWIGGGCNYTGKKAGVVTNPAYFIPPSTIYNLALGYDWTWRSSGMSVLLNWDNISNVEYFPTVQDRGLPERLSLTLTEKF